VLTTSLSGCLSEAYPDQSQAIDAVTQMIEAELADESQQVIDGGATPQDYAAWLMSVASSVQ
jgi:hypothetical protein